MTVTVGVDLGEKRIDLEIVDGDGLRMTAHLRSDHARLLADLIYEMSNVIDNQESKWGTPDPDIEAPDFETITESFTATELETETGTANLNSQDNTVNSMLDGLKKKWLGIDGKYCPGPG